MSTARTFSTTTPLDLTLRLISFTLNLLFTKLNYMFSAIFLSAILIMLASLTGKLATWKGFGKIIQKNTQYLIAFASGIFTVLSISLIQETLELSPSTIWAISNIIFGIIIIHFIIKLLPPAHHHHSVPSKCKHHSRIDARRMMWSDFFHNTGDGILLVGAYTVDIHVGIIATIGIFLHEIVQEISEFFVLKEAGYSTRRALLYNFLVSGSIFIGIILAFSVSTTDKLMLPLMGLATGGFIYALIKDLLPHTIHHAKNSQAVLKHLITFIIGILLMLAVNHLLPHSHEGHHENHLEKHNENS